MSSNIRVRVKNILEQLNITRAPIDPVVIAHHLGLKVEYEPFKGDISGCLLRNKEGGAIIGINSSHHPNRQRFTIAHEIGHYLLHKGELTFVDRKVERVNFRGVPSVADSIEEIEANKFAAELLMPQRFLVKDILASDNIENDNLIDDLAKKYIVSKQALTLRLIGLKI